MPGASEVRITDASSLSGFSNSSTFADENFSASACEINVSDKASLYPSASGPLPECRIHLCARQFHHGAAVSRQRVRELVVPVQPRDLFDHIDLALHIQSPAGNLHAKLRIILPLGNQLESEPLQQTGRSVPRSRLLAQNPPHLAHMQNHRSLVHLSARPRRPHRPPVLRRPTPESSAPPDRTTARSTRNPRPRSKRCDASVCNPVPPRHLPHNARIPPGGFNHDVPRLLGDHRVVSAHDARRVRQVSSRRTRPDLPR